MGELSIGELWRYPVKSMQGISERELLLQPLGVVGDRAYGVVDVTSGTVISAKREARMLLAAALEGEGQALCVRLPSGVELPIGPGLDAALSEWLERPCRLVAAEHYGIPTYERSRDFEDEESGADRWEGPPGSFVDESPVHLVTRASLRGVASERKDLDFSPRRFRPNLVIEADGTALVEQSWLGRRLRVGTAELEVTKACVRCVVTTRAQPGGIDRRLDVLRHLSAAHRSVLGVRARVLVPGVIRVGDPVTLKGVG